MTPFSREAVITACEVIEQAAKGDEELRRALARQVESEDGTADGFNPTAVAFAIWTGARSAAQNMPERPGAVKRVKELEAAARRGVVQWKLTTGKKERHTRQTPDHAGTESEMRGRSRLKRQR